MPDIQSKIILSGEREYKQAIKDASTALHNLGTELGLAQAQYKANGDAQQLVASRSKTLRAEIEQQERIVKLTAGALEDATKKYGENSKQAEQWQAKLNSAKGRLLNFQTELDNNNKGLDKNGRAFETASTKAQNFGGSLSQVDTISKGVTFQSLNTALTNIGGVFERLGQTASKAWKMVWNTASDSSDWADDLATLSLQTGIGVTELQKYAYAADYVDTEVGDITKAMMKLVNPTKEVSDAMKTLGIHRKEAWAIEYENGAVDYYETTKNSVDLFWESIDQMHAMAVAMDGMDAEKRSATEAILDSTAKTLFGKSYQEMMPLILAGREAWEQYGEQAEETGAILGEDLVNNLGAFNDSLQTLQNDYEAFQRIFSAELAPGLETAANAMSGLLEQLNTWMQTDEGKEALGALSKAIADLVTSFTDNVNFSDIVTGAADAIGSLKDGLVWVSENSSAVAGGIATLGAAFAGIKVSQTVLSFLQLIRGFKGIGGASGGGASGGGVSGGGAAAGGSLLTRAAGGVKYVLQSAPQVLGTLGIEAALLGAAMTPMMIGDAINSRERRAFANNARNTALMTADDGGRVTAAKDVVIKAADAIEAGADGLGDSMKEVGDALDEMAGSDGIGGITRLINQKRTEEGGFLVGQEYELMMRGTREALDIMSSPETARGVDSLAKSFAEINDVINEADNNFGAKTPENIIKALYNFGENGNVGALSPTVQAALSDYFTEAEIYGRKGAQFYPEALAMLRMVAGDIAPGFGLGGDSYTIGSRLKSLGAFTIPEITGSQLGSPTLDSIGGFIDKIAGLDYSAGQNADALAGLFDSIKDSNLRKVLSDDTNTLLDLFFNPDEAFGKNSAEAAGLMDLIYSDLSEAYLSGLDDTSSVEDAGKKTSAIFAGGLAAGTGSVLSAAVAWASAFSSALAAAVPAVPRAGGNSTTNYNSANSLYVENYNQYSSADISDLSAALNRESRYARMGVGA